MELLIKKIRSAVCTRSVSLFALLRRKIGFDWVPTWLPHKMSPGSLSNSQPLLKKFKNTNLGETCVILGSAPSVINQDLSSLGGTFVFALNKAYQLKDKLGRQPDAVMLADEHASKEYGNDIVETDINLIFIAEQALKYILKKEDKRFNVFSFYSAPRMHEGFFQKDIVKPLYQSSTVAHYAIQIAAYMGFEKIVLIGVDLDFSGDNRHFYKESLGVSLWGTFIRLPH